MARSKDFDYFKHFEEVAALALETAEQLNNFIVTFDYASANEKISAIHELEHKADEKKHVMMEHLAREFITPIERDDIVSLSEQLDDVIDCIDDVARGFYKYNIKTLRDETVLFSKKIVEICMELEKLIKEFSNFRSSKNLRQHLINVKSLESEGDSIHADSLRRLYSDSSTDREVIIWTNMFEACENCLDSAEDCAGIIESAVLNNT